MNLEKIFPDKLTEKEVEEVLPHQREMRTIDGKIWKIKYNTNNMTTRKYWAEIVIEGESYIVDRDGLAMFMAEAPRLASDSKVPIPCFEKGDDGHLQLTGYQE